MKNYIYLLAFVGILTGLFGCKAPEEPKPEIKEYIYTPVYVASSAIPMESQEKIISNPSVRAYAVGRYIDPNRKTVMHEQHSIYRVEQTPHFNLMPQPDADPVMRAQLEQQEKYADALLGQLNRIAGEMQNTRKTIDEVVRNQLSEIEQSGGMSETMNKLRRDYGLLSDSLLKNSKQYDKLETELKRLKGETDILKFESRTRKGSVEDEN